ncbi:hypothetical protein [Amycolatopsis sp. NBRC 101858]|uniref:hypothetical protein n=1 Tax=Amycolatopsis sp. NBRC 101858 TaxID=3032200 RepID=UPI0025541621|nr:hypothetical protein [Amycolatopsis sp. NBRC 101858]
MDAALGPFAEAATAVEVVERRGEDRVAALRTQLDRKLAELEQQRAAKVAEFERQADQVRADAELEIGEWRSVMATSVAQIRAADVSAAETAALLGISAKEVGALSREAAAVAPAPADATVSQGERRPAGNVSHALTRGSDRPGEERSQPQNTPGADGSTA